MMFIVKTAKTSRMNFVYYNQLKTKQESFLHNIEFDINLQFIL
jgi:hypothetical protein